MIEKITHILMTLFIAIICRYFRYSFCNEILLLNEYVNVCVCVWKGSNDIITLILIESNINGKQSFVTVIMAYKTQLSEVFWA